MFFSFNNDRFEIKSASKGIILTHGFKHSLPGSGNMQNGLASTILPLPHRHQLTGVLELGNLKRLAHGLKIIHFLSL